MKINRILMNIIIFFWFFSLNSMQIGESVILSEREILENLDQIDEINNENLSFLGINLSDLQIEKIVQKCKKLQSITLLAPCKKIVGYSDPIIITDYGFCKIAEYCKNLKSINFGFCDQITDSTVLAFAQNCKFLQKIDFSCCDKITDQSIISLVKNCKAYYYINADNFTTFVSNIRDISLSGCINITDQAINEIAHNCRFLESIAFSGCDNVSEHVIMQLLRYCPSLKKIYLSRKIISEQLCQEFSKYEDLEVYCLF
ncbi:hypothetical protein K9L05_00685 [Candidatus Babeliales bacterium]|nr:hypothetical protein [Candidatus Babeliales bacterium]MCF7899150.1 hypothetical protein [Candidatus Babeliales bacterium]